MPGSGGGRATRIRVETFLPLGVFERVRARIGTARGGPTVRTFAVVDLTDVGVQEDFCKARARRRKETGVSEVNVNAHAFVTPSSASPFASTKLANFLGHASGFKSGWRLLARIVKDDFISDGVEVGGRLRTE